MQFYQTGFYLPAGLYHLEVTFADLWVCCNTIDFMQYTPSYTHPIYIHKHIVKNGCLHDVVVKLMLLCMYVLDFVVDSYMGTCTGIDDLIISTDVLTISTDDFTGIEDPTFGTDDQVFCNDQFLNKTGLSADVSKTGEIRFITTTKPFFRCSSALIKSIKCHF